MNCMIEVERDRLDDHGVEAHHVGVIDACQGATFGERSRAKLRVVGELGADRLHHHRGLGVDVAREVDDPHAAFAEHPLDRVLAVDERALSEVARPRRARSGVRGVCRDPDETGIRSGCKSAASLALASEQEGQRFNVSLGSRADLSRRRGSSRRGITSSALRAARRRRWS